MALVKTEGLDGLPGLYEIDEDTRNKFLLANEDRLRDYKRNATLYKRAAERLYENQKFKAILGEDEYNKYNNHTDEAYEFRKNYLRNHIIRTEAANRFSNDDDFNVLASQLDEQGWLDLMESDYLGVNARRQKLQENIDRPNGETRILGSGMWGMYYSTPELKTTKIADALNRNEELEEKDNEIKEGIFAQVQKRREEAVSDAANNYYKQMLQNDAGERKSLADYSSDFEKLASEKSNHYKAFKNSEWLKDFSDTEKLQTLAKYYALKEAYGETIADAYLERGIQDRVADAQDGEITWNTLMKVGTSFASDFSKYMTAKTYMDYDFADWGIINAGKDPHKPIYNANKEIVDYAPLEGTYTNPAYWNKVVKYNVFNPEEIQLIEEKYGGVSPNVNVLHYGEKPDFFSWNTLEEGFAQTGHIASGIVESFALGAIGKGVGLASNAAMRGLGASGKFVETAGKVGGYMNDFLIASSLGASGAQAEALGTFDEIITSKEEEINKEIARELNEYRQTIDFDSEEAKDAISRIFLQLKGANASGENTLQLPWNTDEALLAQAKQQYQQNLLYEKGQELEELHKADMIEAYRAAGAGYKANFILDWIKEVPLSLAFERFKFAKGSLRGAFDNSIDDTIIADAATGGVKRSKKLAGARNLAVRGASVIGGGFSDEYLDGINASFGEGVANNEFNNYINRTYNPEAYRDAVDGILGNMLAGMSGAARGLTDRDNLYEGVIGAISPFSSVMVNPNAVLTYNPKQTWKAIIQGNDGMGGKLNFLERMSGFIHNPLLNEYAELMENDRQADAYVDAVNRVVASRKGDLRDVAEILTTLGDYSSPIRLYTQKQESGENSSIPLPTMIDSHDEKLMNAYLTITQLQRLRNMRGGQESSWYQQNMHILEGLANDNLSEEELNNEIDRFLSREENKSLQDEPNGREVAAERLKENAKYFLDLSNKLDEINEKFDKSLAFRNMDSRVRSILAYNLASSDDYRHRLETMREELGLNNSISDSRSFNVNTRFGTNEAKNTAIAARERQLKTLDNAYQANLNKIAEAKKNYDELLDRARAASGDEKIQLLTELEKADNLVKSLEFEHAKLQERDRRLKEEISEIKKSQGSEEDVVFNEDDLLGLDFRELAEMLDGRNAGNYFAAQKQVIEAVRNKLLQKDPDAMQKIADSAALATRLADLQTLYTDIQNNSNLASVYLDVAEEQQRRNALAMSLQREIEKHYDNIERAYRERYSSNRIKPAVFAASTRVIRAYMEDHPDQAAFIKPYADMLGLMELANSVIVQGNESSKQKDEMKALVYNAGMNSENLQDMMKYLEQQIDKTRSESRKEAINKLLNTLQSLGFQRDATVLESREQRKRRAERRKQKQEEAKRKEAARAAVEAAVTAASTTTPSAPAEELTDIEIPVDPSTGKPLVTFEETPSMPAPAAPVTPPAATAPETPAEHTEEGPTNEELAQIEQDFYERYVPQAKALPEESLEEYIKAFEKVIADPGELDKRTIAALRGQLKSYKEALAEKQKSKKPVVPAEPAISDTTEDTVTDEFDNVAFLSPEEPDTAEDAVDTVDLDSAEKVDALNEKGQQENDTSDNKFSGNAMNPFDTTADDNRLTHHGILVHKKGRQPDDSMNRYYKWMETTMGIHLQNIIDEELNQIVAANPNPLKIRFMTVRPRDIKKETDVLDDNAMDSHLMLVVDYDNAVNPNIESIHQDKNGGVIKALDKDGKQKEYLIIGTVGYGTSKSRKDLYYALFGYGTNYKKEGIIKTKRRNFFSRNPEERFYVDPDLETEMVPNSLIPGWIVKQLEGEDATESERMKVSELIADEDNAGRNPLNLELKDLVWGIQKDNGVFDIISPTGKTVPVMYPSDSQANVGRVFVMVPASNGKYVPCAIYPLFYNEMSRSCELYTVIMNSINDLLAPVDANVAYEERSKALAKLREIFYLSKDGYQIYLSKDGQTITMKKEKAVLATINLSDKDSRRQFNEALRDKMQLRINVTGSVLNNLKFLKMYDEAGALTTDVAMLHTVGAGYSVYAVDTDGNLIGKDESPKPIPSNVNTRNDNQKQIPYQGRKFYYNGNTNKYTYEDGTEVNDESLIRELTYNKRIANGELVSVMSQENYEYYIISEDASNPMVIKVKDNTHKVTELDVEESARIIAEAKRKRDDAQREAEVQKMFEEIEEMPQTADDNNPPAALEETPQPEPESFAPIAPSGNTKTLAEILVMPEMKVANAELGIDESGVLGFINSCFPSCPLVKYNKRSKKFSVEDENALADFLRSKGVNVTAIDTSPIGLRAWIQQLKCCS